ncbi:MAG: aminotransferase class I/II-fold pyridoxal phosphate-dependent enzyme [Candidatus Omnitrophica bacterium]|nr:aminotransferase class I/II-fold pyridoxal phosphate-dependent enzyme [Candidatus Omnitrophota bacterium]
MPGVKREMKKLDRAKSHLDLAFLGGKPAFENVLHVGCPNIGDRDRLLNRINDILDRRWLTNDGCYVKEFEERIKKLVGVKHCVAVCNGTVALEIAIRALDLSGEVIVPSMTALATVHALTWQGIKPIFCDIDSETLCVDPKKVEELITERTTGILAVHLFGRPCHVKALETIAKSHRLKLLFDAAHAFGCSSNGKMIGGFGDAETLSFHATKFLNTLEGGAVVTNDNESAEKIRLMRNFGYSDSDHVVHIGINGKMNEVSAAMGLTSLERMKEIIEVNRRNYLEYRRELGALPGVKVMDYNETERCNYQYVVLEIDRALAGIDRDALLEVLQAEHVLARRYFHPGCHRVYPYQSLARDQDCKLRVTEEKSERLLQLPTGTSVGPLEVRKICALIGRALVNAEAIKTFLECKTMLQKKSIAFQKTITSPMVSIVTPTYNRPAYLPRAIESVVNQTYQDWELIVVDDGCPTDDIRKVVNAYLARDRRIHYVRRTNGSWYRARNTGIENARGKYVAFIDDDDEWRPEKLERQVDFMESHPEVGLSYTLLQVYRARNGKAEPTKIFPQFLASKFQELFNVFIPTTCVMIRKSCLDQIDWFNPEFPICADFDFWLRFAQQWPIAPMENILASTVMDDRDHGGQDEVSVRKDAIRVLRALRLNGRYTQYGGLVKSQIAARFYILGRLLIDQGNYMEAAKYFVQALFEDPLVGLVIRRPEEQGFFPLLRRVAKSYVAAPVCLVKGLHYGRR